MISQRAQQIKESGIRKVLAKAGQIPDVINLCIGIPDFGASTQMQQAAIEAIQDGNSVYTHTQGLAELRMAIAQERGLPQDDSLGVLITSGSSAALFLTMAALLDPGDEILIPDPYFSLYVELPKIISAVPKLYSNYPSFRFSADNIEAGISKRTKAILINSPANPTGAVMNAAELQAILEIASKHNLWVIYDEIYSEFVYGVSHLRFPLDYPRLVEINSYSKSHGVTGWRIGYAIAPQRLIQAMAKVQQHTLVCASSISQAAVLHGRDFDHAHVRKDYQARRDFVWNALKDNYEINCPEGAFYFFIKSPAGTATEFCERAADKKLLVVPGNVFSEQDSHFRLCFSVPQEKLEKGVKILQELA